MKGIIFREFLNMVEEEFGDVIADKIITDSTLPTRGAYTSVGTYNHQELFELVTNLSKHTLIPTSKLVKDFGVYTFKTFSTTYSSMFNGVSDGFSFLSLIEEKIHVDVLKLYPEAELPRIEVIQPDKETLILTYFSARKMSDFAEGLIIGCMNYFSEKISINKEALEADGSIVKFTIRRF